MKEKRKDPAMRNVSQTIDGLLKTAPSDEAFEAIAAAVEHAPQTETTSQKIREIPDTMWERIAAVREIARTDPFYSLRSRLLMIGDAFRFTESELVERGIISALPKPDPSANKGGRRQ
jgi:hypothetical protein